ncbi:MAG TPA: glycosyltransferase family A protein [Pedobacter sp.]|jgi:glycosyltransferase involved in cell wall biosynthesis
MSINQALLSILMPAYNVEKFVSQSIRSVLDQKYQNFELIIVDDCSTDNTLGEIIKFKDSRIKLLKNQQNSGVSQTRNKLLDSANGKYIAFLDADDLCHKDRFIHQIAFLEKNLDYGLIGSKLRYINENGESLWLRVADKVFNWREIQSELLFNNVLSTSTVTFRNQIIDHLKNDLVHDIAEDYYMWSQLSIKGIKMSSLNEDLVKYRVRNSGSTNVHYNKLKQSFDLIHTSLLNNVGVHVSQSVLNVHNALLTPLQSFDLNLLTSNPQHYKNIIDANSTTQIYSRTHLLKSIRKNWFIKCRRSLKSKGFQVLYTYIYKFNYHNITSCYRLLYLTLFLIFYKIKAFDRKAKSF